MMADDMHLYLDDAPLGAYVANVRVSPWSGSTDDDLKFTLGLDALYSLRLHVDNAIRSLHERQLSDLACGSCSECSNTRMIHPLRHGHLSAEHCPTCQPKLQRANALMSTGLGADT